jgi:hypothetical protein
MDLNTGEQWQVQKGASKGIIAVINFIFFLGIKVNHDDNQFN